MIVIIGAPHHGKSTLAEAIKIITEKHLEVMTTDDLMLASKEQSKLEEGLKELSMAGFVELNELKTDERKNHRKKGKEVKNWQRTKFYQR